MDLHSWEVAHSYMLSIDNDLVGSRCFIKVAIVMEVAPMVIYPFDQVEDF